MSYYCSKKPRPNKQGGGGGRGKKPGRPYTPDIEGSGRYVDAEDNQPIAIPMIPSRNKNEYHNGRHATVCTRLFYYDL